MMMHALFTLTVRQSFMSLALVMGLAAFTAWIYLAVANGFFWLPLVAKEPANLKTAPSVDIIVPARNEAKDLPQTLPSLLAQRYSEHKSLSVLDLLVTPSPTITPVIPA